MLTSVFYIHNKKSEPDYINTWNPGNRSYSTGSGFGIQIKDKKYIMTNAHVVENSNFIDCKKYNSDKRFVLNIVDIASEIDLAVIACDENEYDDFWKDVPIMKISTPALRGEVVKVVGFPQGGSNPSITKGIVSRIIPMVYSRSVLNLAIQVDSAINPGNSGGPVFNNDDCIIGVAFSHSVKGQNICYIIPSFIILHYIQSLINFKKFPGICDLDIDVTSLENKSIRDYYLDGDHSLHGILINRVNPTGSAGHLLKIRDVIHQIDDIQINDDQTILIENYQIVNKPTENTEKVPFWHILRLKHPGDSIKLLITRDKKQKTITFKINVMAKKLIPSLSNSISRSYYSFGGLIFMPLNFWYLCKPEDHDNWQSISRIMDINKAGLFKYLENCPEFADEEIVILNDILQSPLTSGYKMEHVRLMKINNITVKNIEHVHEICESANEEFTKFEFENNKIIILNTKIAKLKSNELSQKYLGVKYHNI